MIVIENVQLTPKRVPIGGNYLLRVLARYIEDGGDDVTITTQDVPLTWTLSEDLKLLYAPLELYPEDYARVIHAYLTPDGEIGPGGGIVAVPGIFTIGVSTPMPVYLGQLYDYAPGEGFAICVDIARAMQEGGQVGEVMVDLFQELFTQARLYILQEE